MFNQMRFSPSMYLISDVGSVDAESTDTRANGTVKFSWVLFPFMGEGAGALQRSNQPRHNLLGNSKAGSSSPAPSLFFRH